MQHSVQSVFTLAKNGLFLSVETIFSIERYSAQLAGVVSRADRATRKFRSATLAALWETRYTVNEGKVMKKLRP